MNEPCKFSIIVPSCNVGKYIGDTIASLLAQTYSNWECLLMVEESTDNTLEICRQAVEKDTRFRLFTAPRSGSCSVPRNSGMKNATGDYVLFVDGDDWIEKNTLETFAQAIARHGQLDFIAAAANEYLEDDSGNRTFSRKWFNYRPEDNDRIMTGKEAVVYVGKHMIIPLAPVWQTLYRLDFLRAHNMSYIPGSTMEDEEWSPRVLFLAEKLCVLDFPFYCYRRRSSSTTTARKAPDLHSAALGMKSLFAFYVQHKAEVTPDIAFVWQRSWLTIFFRSFFYPPFAAHATDVKRREELKILFQDDGMDNFNQLIRIASFPKRVAAIFIRLGRWTTIPACLFFKYIYYPLLDAKTTAYQK